MLLELLFAAALFGVAVAASVWTQWRGGRGAVAVLFGALAPALVLAALLFGVRGPDGQMAYREVKTEASAFFQSQADVLLKNGSLPADRLDASRQFLEKIYVDLLPGWIASTCLLLGLMAYYFSGRLLSRLSSRVPSPPPYRSMTFPEPLVFGLILAVGFLAIAPITPQREILNVWGGCLLVAFGTLYFMVGTAVMSHFLWKWRLHPLLRVALYALMFLTPSSIPALGLLGVLDLWMDFRRIKPPTLREETES
jgi:hypothetical protein